MTLVELQKLLEVTGYPVAYSHFNNPTNPPFITYQTAFTSNFAADNKVYYKVPYVRVDLYTRKKEPSVESKLESVFDNASLPYEITTDIFIDSENVRQIIYEITLL